MKRFIAVLVALILLSGTAFGTVIKDDMEFKGKVDVSGGTLDVGCATTQFLISDGTDLACKTISGDITCTNAGVCGIGSDKVTSDDVLDGQLVNADVSTSAEIAVSKLANGTNAQMLISNSTLPQWKTITGMFGISNTGMATPTTSTLTATANIEATDCGTTFFIDAAGDTEYAITLPAIADVSAGCEYVFIVIDAPESADYTIVTDSLEDKIMGGTYGGDGNGGAFVTTGDTITIADGQAVLGDKVILFSDGSYYYATAFANVVAGIVLSDEN